ncbi:MAG: hypothetical protein IBX48_02240 [Thiomicrospira sp.]|uniref:ATP-binding protein n=2 Tax=Thiomicrospira sp. TaxID=935 RepID=UPI0019F24F00|nr:ATP-binding protein [Thiomicrospira sp.]MBE0493136.1 hypothetical protein [Thiomicrospira sp.]
MKFRSLRTQFNRGFGFTVSLVFLVFWGLGLSAVYFGSQYWVGQQLTADARALLTQTQWSENQPIEVDISSQRVNFSEPGSGHYFVLYAQGQQHIDSPSLDGYVLPLPERTSADVDLFIAEGPNQKPVLVSFGSVEFNDRWLDLAVAKDYTLETAMLKQFYVFYSALIGLLWLITLGLSRYFLGHQLGHLPNSKQLGLQSLQADIFGKRWPSEWMPLADHLHQALIQLRARMVLNDQKPNAYQIHWPRDLRRHIDAYQASHPDLQIKLNYTPEDATFLIAQTDMDLLLKNLLNNAVNWSESQVMVSVAHLDDRLCLRFEDDGEGMAADRLEQIQQRSQARQPGEEPGGLQQVEQMVYAYQGHLVFGHSESLGGLLVELYFDRPKLELG